MTQEQILKLAREAGLTANAFGEEYIRESADIPNVLRFAELLQKHLKS